MTFDDVKDSGQRQQWDTGSQRDAQEGKGRWDLIPFLPMERLAQHFENGAKKYDDDNWKKGQNLRQYVNSMLRHAFKMAEGWTDEDHAAAVAWNAFAFIWTKDAIDRGLLPAELDDIPWRDEDPALLGLIEKLTGVPPVADDGPRWQGDAPLARDLVVDMDVDRDLPRQIAENLEAGLGPRPTLRRRKRRIL